MGTILLENSVVVATKAKHMPVLWPAFPSLVTYLGKWVHMSKGKSIQEFYSSIICNISNCNVPMSLRWPKCQSAKEYTNHSTFIHGILQSHQKEHMIYNATTCVNFKDFMLSIKSSCISITGKVIDDGRW